MSKPQNIQFDQLTYRFRDGMFKRSSKTVLKCISGEFRAYELSAIMGPSGSGKTTLLNILSGFISTKMSGTVKVNGDLRDNKSFRKQCAFIMQEENLHSLLTVHESMNFSIKLKTGSAFSAKERKEKILEILQVLGLDDKMDTFAGMLSGGQQKRLSIALELVDDPQIMFFDEPTTGLDSSSSRQCLSLMKKLAQSGKTIICTIHQPSALLFEMFDHLYALSDGMCIYQGSSKNLVPFLAELDLVCPESYNPSDYLLEIATNDYGPQNDRLTESIQNGQCCKYRMETVLQISEPIDILNDDDKNYLSSFSHQLSCLIARNILILKRDMSPIKMRLAVHFVVAILTGLLYLGLGNEASQIINIYKFIFISIFFLMYTSYYSLQTTFPLELPIVRREHYNRWYSTEAYYLALSLTDIPLTVVSNLLYISMTYVMTDMPMEGFRVGWFVVIGLLTSFIAQGFGLLAGSMFDLKGTLVFAAVFLPLYAIFSGVLILMKDTAYGWHWIFELSFVKHAFDGASNSILGYSREKMNCADLYCHFQWPHKFLESIGVDDNMYKVIQSLLAFLVIFRLTAYCIINYRLKH